MASPLVDLPIIELSTYFDGNKGFTFCRQDSNISLIMNCIISFGKQGRKFRKVINISI